MKLRSKLGQSRGLGSAKSGVGHWKAQRISAIALIPLVVWFIASFVVMLPAPFYVVYEWMQSPWTIVGMISLAMAMFYHGYLGIQVVIEDYIPNEGIRFTLLLACKFASIFMGLLAVVSCLIILLK